MAGTGWSCPRARWSVCPDPGSSSCCTLLPPCIGTRLALREVGEGAVLRRVGGPDGAEEVLPAEAGSAELVGHVEQQREPAMLLEDRVGHYDGGRLGAQLGIRGRVEDVRRGGSQDSVHPDGDRFPGGVD